MPLGSGGGVIRTQAFRLQSLGSKPVLLVFCFESLQTSILSGLPGCQSNVKWL